MDRNQESNVSHSLSAPRVGGRNLLEVDQKMIATMTVRARTILALLAVLLIGSHGFIQSPSLVNRNQASNGRNLLKHPQKLPSAFARPAPSPRTHSVARFGFQLPPGKKNDNGLSEILMGALSIVGLIAFFASPLGGLFFAAINSVLALLFITPLVFIVGFNAWQYFNTVEGNCPSCSAPMRVLKDGSPSICFNCGSVVQNNDGKLDFAPNVDQFEQEESIFSFFDQALSTTSPKKESGESRKDQYRRETTVIDVDVEDIDKK